MKRTAALLYLFVFLYVPLAGAQEAARQLLFRQLSISEGLSQSTVGGFAQDRTGYLWVATDDGINRFDGHSFRVFRPAVDDSLSLSGFDIREVLLSIRGDLIVAGRSGDLSIFDPLTHRVNRIVESKKQDKMPYALNSDVAEDRYGRIWAATDSGLYVVQPDRSTVERINDAVLRKTGRALRYYAVAEIENEVYWLSIGPVGLVQYNLFDKSFTVLIDRNAPEFKDIIITTIYKESNGNIWVGTRTHGILHWKAGLKKWQIYNSTNGSGLESDIVNSFVEDLEGNVWVGTTGGLALYDEDRKAFTSYSVASTNAEGLLEDNIQGMYIDRSNNLWVGTRQRGAFVTDLKKQRFEYVDFARQGIRTFLSSVVWSFAEDSDGFTWVGTEGGLFRLDGNQKIQEHFHSKLGKDNIHRALKDDFVSALAANGDEIWIGTSLSGMQRYNRKTGAMDFVDPVLQMGNTGYRSSNVIRVQGERVWVGTFAGVYTIDRKTLEITQQFPHTAGLPATEIWDIAPNPDSSLWVVAKAGVFRYEPAKATATPLDLPIFLASNANSILIDSTLAWIGTTLGMVRYELETGQYRLFAEADGLPNAFVYGALQAHPGEIWASTNRGLSRIRYSYREADSISFRNYAHLDGVHNLEYNAGALTRLSSGTMLFGGISGVDVIRPDNVYDNPFEPNVVVNDITVFNGTESRRISITDGKPVRLPYFENVFTIDVAALEFTQPELNRFEYMLEGFDDDWVQSNRKPFIVYTNLDPAKYVFKVRASNNDGIWVTRPFEVKIEIIPPFWQTMPFYAFMLLLFFSGIAVSVNIRERKLREQNVMLEERVLQRTKELQESEEIFRLISETALDLIAIVDEKGTILYANPAHATILGYDEAELIGQPMTSFIHPDDVERNTRYFHEMISRGRGSFPDYRIKSKSGAWLVFASSASRVAESGAGRQRFVMLSHDYSKQREITEQLTRSKEEAEQASRSKSAFLASMSHELKTPLNSILGFTQILQEDTSLSDRHRNNLATMYESGKHLLKMIEEILDLSKIEAGKMQVNRIDFDLEQLFRELDARTRKRLNAASIVYERIISPDLPPMVNTDYEKLLTVLYNFLDNAIKHGQGGSIGFDATYFSQMPARRKSVSGLAHLETLSPSRQASSATEMIRFVVRDSGSGLQPEELDSIFRPFNKSNPSFSRGIGLGLAISWRLISLMDGWLEIFAEREKGTEIHVWIPVQIPVGKARPEGQMTSLTTPHTADLSAADPVSPILEAIRTWPDPEQRANLMEAIDLMDAEMIGDVLETMKAPVFGPLAQAAESRNFSLLITLNERLHPVG